MNSIDIVGWLAGSLVLAAFYVKTMLPLRGVAIASNVAFIGYGLMAHAMPILVLHSLLLPLNLLRLQQLWCLNRRIASTSCGDFPMQLLAPYLDVHLLLDGSIVFEKGSHAGKMYLLLRGQVQLLEAELYVAPGELVGALDIFAPQHCYLDTAVCQGEVELASISEQKFWELFHLSPQFGAYLMRQVVLRQLEANTSPRRADTDPEDTRRETNYATTSSHFDQTMLALAAGPFLNWKNPS